MQENTTHPGGNDKGNSVAPLPWFSLNKVSEPARYVVADDTMSADEAYRLACEGTALCWKGDFQNARQMLQALGRRIDRKKQRKKTDLPADMATVFHKHRQAQAQRARILGMLLIPFDDNAHIPLRRAPDVREQCTQVFTLPGTPFMMPLRELLGVIGAYEWRRKGVQVPAINGVIHPFYGVFSPVRGEYVDLVKNAPLPKGATVAFDIGTGTGVLAAVLAQRGCQTVIATDQDAQALACASFNITQLGLDRIQLEKADLFPEGKASLIVCNPPWIPAKPSAAIEYAVYDPESTMLRGYLDGLSAHLLPGGEGWLILSDIAEHLGLRSREQLLAWIADAGLVVAGKTDTTPRHAKAQDKEDPLYLARSKEITSLWRLQAK